MQAILLTFVTKGSRIIYVKSSIIFLVMKKEYNLIWFYDNITITYWVFIIYIYILNLCCILID